MAKIQEKYEVLYIVDPRKTEEETAAYERMYSRVH